MSDIKRPIILLDLDDTILDFHKAEAVALRSTLETMGLEVNDAIVSRYSEINASLWELLERGEIKRERLLTRRYEMLFAELGINRSGDEAQSIYEKRLSEGCYYLPGAEKLLEALFGKYALYIISNGTASIQDRRIAGAGLAKYFDDIFISQRIGFDKPRKEFFDTCAEKITGFSRENALIIGDSLTSDILGGINSGIRTCWFNPKGKARREDIVPDYEVSSHDEIPALLNKIF